MKASTMDRPKAGRLVTAEADAPDAPDHLPDQATDEVEYGAYEDRPWAGRELTQGLWISPGEIGQWFGVDPTEYDHGHAPRTAKPSACAPSSTSRTAARSRPLRSACSNVPSRRTRP